MNRSKGKASAVSRLKHFPKERARLARQTLIRILGGKCIRCGFCDWRALQVDHVNGLPRENRLINLIQLINDIKKSFREGVIKYQLLCANCNWIKRYENDEVGRERSSVDLSSGGSV